MHTLPTRLGSVRRSLCLDQELRCPRVDRIRGRGRSGQSTEDGLAGGAVGRAGSRDPFPTSGVGREVLGWSPDEWGSARVPRGSRDPAPPTAPPASPPPALWYRKRARVEMLRDWPAFEA